MIVAGIDPGKTGALFLFSTEQEDGCAADALRVPLTRIKGKERPDFIRWSDEWCGVIKRCGHIFVEQVGAMPGQGVTSMFSFGYSAGFVYGLVAGEAHTFVTPQKWKKIVGLSGSDGEESRRRASQLFPSCVDFWPRKKDHGVAEAALIAYAGAQILKGAIDG